MAELTEIVRENVGTSSHAMRLFFQHMVRSGELKAYQVEIDKKVIEKNTEDESVVRTKKGVTLTPTEELNEYQAVFVEDPKTGVMYNLNIESWGGAFYNDGDSQTIYHSCVLERITPETDLKRVAERYSSNFGNKIFLPEMIIAARLTVRYHQDWESGANYDYVAGTEGSLIIGTNKDLVVNGEQDQLFEKVCSFVRGKYLHQKK